MKRRLKWLLGTVGTLLVLILLANAIEWWVVERPLPDAGKTERDVREALPPGTSQPTINQYVSSRGWPHLYDPSKHEETALLRRVRGNDFLIQTSILYTFHFDDAAKLKSIETKMELTGP
jgi:hypothetical protein